MLALPTVLAHSCSLPFSLRSRRWCRCGCGAGSLSLYQHSLQERLKQTEQMAAELSLSHAQASEYKYEIGRVTKELRETKKKYFEQKKREQHATEVLRAQRSQPPELLAHEARATLNRFTGGGFNLNQLAS